VNKAHPEQRLMAMLRIRRFEEQCIALAAAQQLPGHYHVYIGQEATAVTACESLQPEDFLFSTWRNHGHLLARGASTEKMLAEILGRTGGYAGGKSGTLHLSVRELGIPSTSALVGGSLPLALGAALACKRRDSGIAVAFFGDAALEEGAFYEAMLVAQVWQVPILFVCENNSIPPTERKRGQYTSSTLPAQRLGDVPQALQVPQESVDGTDIDGLAAAFARLTGEVRAGGGPRFIEVCCPRWPGNIMTWPELTGGNWQTAWAFGASTDHAGMAVWLKSDPLLLYIQQQVAAGRLDRATVDAIDDTIQAEMRQAARFAIDSPFPAVQQAYQQVFAEQGAQV
jgi:TPP-dependent pyruvate/acetoin dehydrogenase alpha subunit